MIAIADTGFILAVAVATDKRHAECLSVYRKCSAIYLPQSTLAEVAYLLTRTGGNKATAYFLHGLSRTKYRLVALEVVDIIRTAICRCTY
jgi:predicted nucleic acid-binding protein